MKKCKNKCIFCFIDQLPKNLRPSLYIKDDDYVESFKFGNFITLTNLNNRDIDKIIKYNLSPLYVSFHSADKKIREYIFGIKNNDRSIEFLKILDEKKIETNMQIVLCPRVNDGTDLMNTLNFLRVNFKNIISIGIVPVGVTKFNKNSDISSFNKESSINLIESIKEYKNKSFKNNIFLSDEFYIMAKRDFPESKFYGSYPQIENGIGLCRNFTDDIRNFIANLNKNSLKKSDSIYRLKPSNNYDNFTGTKENIKKSILVLTSEYFYKTMNDCMNELAAFSRDKKLNLNIKVKYVKNEFFGGNVKVSGLLTYSDFNNIFTGNTNFKKKELNDYDKILIPKNIFNNEGLTLDNKTKKDFKNIYTNIKFINTDGKSLLKEIIFK
ncbi:MAG: DUF512 domain-containing protein [Actinomycetota bacterium]|nr:DUF512 domain-containing protein [Actinomycetota bacterium]